MTMQFVQSPTGKQSLKVTYRFYCGPWSAYVLSGTLVRLNHALKGYSYLLWCSCVDTHLYNLGPISEAIYCFKYLCPAYRSNDGWGQSVFSIYTVLLSM